MRNWQLRFAAGRASIEKERVTKKASGEAGNCNRPVRSYIHAGRWIGEGEKKEECGKTSTLWNTGRGVAGGRVLLLCEMW
jgi:hypothetical protein